MDAHWRRYNGFQTIRNAWIGYDLNKQQRVKVGITKVPFGIKPYSYNSYWGDLNYYLGFTETYATGVKLEQHLGAWDLDYAFFKNPAYSDALSLKRYSFHVVNIDTDHGHGHDHANSEVNQLNFRAARHFQ